MEKGFNLQISYKRMGGTIPINFNRWRNSGDTDPAGRRLLRSTCVEPYREPIFGNPDVGKMETSPATFQTYGGVNNHAEQIRKDPRPERSRQKLYQSTRKEEFRGLIVKGNFKPISKYTLPQGTRVFG